MAKRVTKSELVAKHSLEANTLKGRVVELENENLQYRSGADRDAKQINMLSGENQRIATQNTILMGRMQEVITHHDILLRASLRDKGMSWEDIDRLIADSRRAFGFTGQDFGRGSGGVTMGRGF